MQAAVRELGSHCAAALFAGDAPLFALADGTVHRWDACVAAATTRAHSALLAAAASADRSALYTSGEDGRVCRTGGAGAPVEIATVPRKWIDCVAVSPLGALAYASGRSVWLHGADGAPRELQHARSVPGIAFSPDGARLAVARYGGVTLHVVAGGAAPLELESKGIYAGLSFSPDGRFLMAFMQEALLHGWRLPRGGSEAKHFRMSGYPARIKDWSWSVDGRWLATSGAPSAIAWSFDGKDGPMGTTALELGAPREGALVTAVACHPSRALLAIGYADGALALASLDSGEERELRGEGRGALALASLDSGEERELRGEGRGAVSALAWHGRGARLAFGCESGECGLIDIANG